ncbi:MAG: hypothetical protein IPO63_17635 [Bacteroidetes bacterium]|nr:hypothetical protein [Bacteroidota bacterium]
MKESVSQFIECIPQGSVSTGRLNIAEDLKKNIIKSQNRLPGDITFTLEALFEAVNKQTLALLEKEIKLWSPRETDLPKESQYFLEELKRLREEAIEASGEKHTAIARLGFATGFDSITGGWQSEKLSTASMNELANAVRRKDYGDMPFPKSRRIVIMALQ